MNFKTLLILSYICLNVLFPHNFPLVKHRFCFFLHHYKFKLTLSQFCFYKSWLSQKLCILIKVIFFCSVFSMIEINESFGPTRITINRLRSDRGENRFEYILKRRQASLFKKSQALALYEHQLAVVWLILFHQNILGIVKVHRMA